MSFDCIHYSLVCFNNNSLHPIQNLCITCISNRKRRSKTFASSMKLEIRSSTWVITGNLTPWSTFHEIFLCNPLQIRRRRGRLDPDENTVACFSRQTAETPWAKELLVPLQTHSGIRTTIKMNTWLPQLIKKDAIGWKTN